jgi:hypothetical protein
MNFMKTNRMLAAFTLLMSITDVFAASTSETAVSLDALGDRITTVAATMPTDRPLTLVIGSCPWDVASESTSRVCLYENTDVYTLGKSEWTNDKYPRKDGIKYDTSRYFNVDFNEPAQLNLLARLLPGRFTEITFDVAVTKYWDWRYSKHVLGSFLALLKDGGAFYIPQPGVVNAIFMCSADPIWSSGITADAKRACVVRENRSDIDRFTASFACNGFGINVVDCETLTESAVKKVIRTARYFSSTGLPETAELRIKHAAEVMVARRDPSIVVNLGREEEDPYYIDVRNRLAAQKAAHEAQLLETAAAQAALAGPTEAHLRELLLNPAYVAANIDAIIGSRDYIVLKRAYHDVWEKLYKTTTTPDYRQVVEAIIPAMSARTLTPAQEAEILSKPSNHLIGSCSRKHWMPSFDPAAGRFQ